MDEEKTMNDWGIKLCPLLNKQCLKEQCAWWDGEGLRCAIPGIKDVLGKTK